MAHPLKLFFQHDPHAYRCVLLLLLFSQSIYSIMIVQLSMFGALFLALIGIAEGSRTSLLRANDDAETTFPIQMATPERGGLRKLNTPCWHGGQEQDDLTWLVRGPSRWIEANCASDK